MSKIQAVPFIREVMNTLSNEQKSTLASLIDGSVKTPIFRSLINRSHYITAADKGVKYMSIEAKDRTLTGYLVYNDIYCVLVSYMKNTQNLTITAIDVVNQSYSVILEYLTILEFRFVIEELLSPDGAVTAEEISSEDATAGKALLADGEGGAEWEWANPTVPLSSTSGTLTDEQFALLAIPGCRMELDSKIYQLDSESETEFVFKAPARVSDDNTLVEAITVTKSTKAFEYSYDVVAATSIEIDRYVDPTSENPVENRGVAEALVLKADATDLAPAYDSTATYAVGDLVTHESKFYKCKTAISVAEAWTAAHWDETTVDAELETKLTKGDYDGTTGVGYADVAKSLETTVGNDDETPFSFATVGIDSDVETGLQELRKLVGVDVVDNQLVANPDFTSASNWASSNSLKGSIAISGGELAYTVIEAGSAYDNGFYQQLWSTYQRIGHKILVLLNMKASKNGIRIGYDICGASDGGAGSITLTTTYAMFGFVIESDGGGNLYICTRYNTTEANDVVYCKKACLIDLTQRYGSNDVVNAIIGNDASKQVERLIAFDPNILKLSAYDAGSFPVVKAAKLETTDYNQLNDEAVSTGHYWNNSGEQASSANFDCFDELIQVKPNTKYGIVKGSESTYSGTYVYGLFLDANGNAINTYSDTALSFVTGYFTTPENAMYLAITSAFQTPLGASPKICVFLYWDGSRIGYEPYKKHEVPLPNVQLHGVLKVVDDKVVADGDERYPDGTGKTRYGSYTFTGSETWTGVGSYSFKTTISDIAYAPSNSVIPSILNNAGLTPDNGNNIYAGTNDMTIGVSSDSHDVRVYISGKDGSQIAAFMAGKTIIYPLATEIDVASTPYPESFYGDDFGTMSFLDEDGNEIPGLLGNEIFYKANVAGFAETLYVKTDGDPDDLVTQGELSAVSARIPALPSDSEDGTYVLKATMSDGTITYAWVAEGE